MIGETIKWRIKIVNLTDSFFLGIGLKTVLKNNNFIWAGYYDKHGCYMVAQEGSSYTYLDN